MSKLFDDMTPIEKIDHIERCMSFALGLLKGTYNPYDAEILDVWDYWAPYMIQRLRNLEKVAEAARWVRYRRDHAGNADNLELWARKQQLDDALQALEKP